MATEAAPKKRGRTEDEERTLQTLMSSAVVLSTPPEGDAPFVCTHSGSFHADEALACSMLRMLPLYRDMPIVRTRNPDIIAKGTIVVDVGGEYDAETRRFDHHQRSFTSTYDEKHGIKMSSAGLVFKHLGGEIIRGTLDGEEVDDDTVELLLRKMYTGLIMEIDAIDNGVNIAKDPAYRISTNLSSRVGRLNPAWNEEGGPLAENEQFKKAMLAGATEWSTILRNLYYSWLPARSIVESSLEAATDVHPSGSILKLSQYCPWKSHLYDLEATEKHSSKPKVLYVLYEDSSGKWRIQCVSVSADSFTNRKSLPEPWQGLRDEDLSKAVGVPGAIFVHASGFIGGHTTYEGVLSMATQALEL